MLNAPVVRDALRSLRRSPALSLAAVCCIALGNVATTAIATLVEATLLGPLPFPNAERLARVWIDERDVNSRLDLSIPEAMDLAEVGSFEAYGLVEQDTRRYISFANLEDPRSARLDVYVPLAQFPMTIVSIAAATSGDARALVEPLRRRIAAIAPTSAVQWTSTMADEVGLEYAPSRFYALLVAGLSCGALAVAAMHGLLYEVGLFDSWAFAGALALLCLVTALAGLVPARRIASVDSLQVMRAD